MHKSFRELLKFQIFIRNTNQPQKLKINLDEQFPFSVVRMYGEIMSKKEKQSKKKKKVNEGLDRVKKTFWGLTGWAVYGAKNSSSSDGRWFHYETTTSPRLRVCT